MSEQKPEVVRLDKIDPDASPHVRVCLNEEVLQDYIQRHATGTLFPPLDLFWDSEANAYLIADGRHRFDVFQRAGEETLLARVHEGGARSALQYALSANSGHGLRRTNADIRLVCTTVLQDAEWKDCSDRVLAGLCNVDHKTIAKFRKELAPDISEEVPENKGETTEDGQVGNSPPAGKRETATRKRKGADGKDYPAEAAKPPKSVAPVKAKPGGKEAVSPEDRKAAKAAFGTLVRLTNRIPEWQSAIGEDLARIADVMKPLWGRGGK